MTTPLIWNNALLWEHLEVTRKTFNKQCEHLLWNGTAPLDKDAFVNGEDHQWSAFFPYGKAIGGMITAQLVEDMLYLRLLWVNPYLRGGGCSASMLNEWLRVVTERASGPEPPHFIATDIRLVLCGLFTRHHFVPGSKPPDMEDEHMPYPEAPPSDRTSCMPEKVMRYNRFELWPRVHYDTDGNIYAKHWSFRPSRAAEGRPSVFCSIKPDEPAFVIGVDRGMYD